ncbi:MAG TPA: isocitrate lyase/phosphoenolpyruvate mutase family protein [Candidatus Tumulicola sp.]|jgi:2-methylisocitrate lyase-like PEP mutase family enzyme
MPISETVATFRALHRGASVLLLPNAWDAATTASFAAAGAKAIATTSAGLAWACGFPDGDALPRADLLHALGSIVAVSGSLPVSADVESGFTDDPLAVADLVLELCALGIAGINLEDGTQSPELLAAKIAAIKRAVAERGFDIFVNARTDVYLREFAGGDEAVRETIARAQRYASAGADGIFAPALADPDAIARIANAVALPLSLMAVPELPPAADLYAYGVRRLSAGSALAELAYGQARSAADAFLHGGGVGPLFAGTPADYRETNEMLIEARAKRG